jgi:hypothetical protein
LKKLIVGALLLAVLALAAGCKSDYPDVPEKSLYRDNTSEVVIYVPAENNILDAQLVEVEKSGNKYRDSLQALLGDDGEFFPKKVKIIDITVDDQGLATVDFDRRILDKKAQSQPEEALGISAIVRTLTEITEVKQVTFTVEGKSEGKIGGKQIEDWWGFGGFKYQPFGVSGSSGQPID